jgi:2-dehydropantoate 2-reductase
MRHAILGAGGVGGLIGACLAHAGDDVTMVVRSGTLERFPDRLQLESPLGDVTAPVKKAAQAPPADVLWIAVKATQLEDALRSVSRPDIAGAVVPLLNGIDHVETLRARFGHERVVPATIAGETERTASGHIVHRSPFARLNVAASGRGRLSDAVEKLQGHGFICRFIDNEATLLWGKLVFLAPFALATTAFDTTIGRVFANPQWRSHVAAAVGEACSVAVAEGALVDAERVLSGSQTLPFEMRSSMQKDVDRGNPPELDAIGGPIVRGGARHGIAVPVTRALMTEVEKRAGLVAD